MKTKLKKLVASTVEELRNIRDKIGIEIQEMNHDSIKKYFGKKTSLFPKRVWK
jgi:hypothetical protein